MWSEYFCNVLLWGRNRVYKLYIVRYISLFRTTTGAESCLVYGIKSENRGKTVLLFCREFEKSARDVNAFAGVSRCISIIISYAVARTWSRRWFYHVLRRVYFTVRRDPPPRLLRAPRSARRGMLFSSEILRPVVRRWNCINRLNRERLR